MAKYTELLVDYMKDNELPSIFSEIEGFKDLFIKRFCDHEIGFETEELFKTKLDLTATTMIPLFKEKIENVKIAMKNALDPSKSTNSKINNGKRKSKIKDLPINSDGEGIDPNQISEQDATEDHSEIVEKGSNGQDAIAIAKFFNDKIRSIMVECLNEFQSLFMQIY